MSGTRFGRDAIAKAEAVVQRAEEDLARGDVRTLLDTMQSLDRTLGMFKNVMHKKSEAAHR
jgi:molecular chaperone DnaK